MTSYSTVKSMIESRYLEIKGCGANAPGGGGFRAGNTCSKGGKGSESIQGEFLAYHGTTSEALDSIMEHGLVPAKGKGGDSYAEKHMPAMAQQFKSGDRQMSVYMTSDRTVASLYAERAVEQVGGASLILEIKVPINHLNKLVADEHDRTAKRFKGTISPSWISVSTKNIAQIIYAVILADKESDA